MTSKRVTRTDAKPNRSKTIDAASQIMREVGGGGPLELIAEHAGLTRATLYRNFADRRSLFEAVLEHHLERFAQRGTESTDIDSLAFLRRLTTLTAFYYLFLVASSGMPESRSAIAHIRILAAIAPSLAKWQARGFLRPSLAPHDVLIACRMLGSPGRLEGEREAAIERRLSMIVGGLGVECSVHNAV